MEGNGLSSLQGINKIKALGHLEVAGNSLSELPESINTLVNLIYLNLSDNKFADKPDVLRSMPQCKVRMYEDEDSEYEYEINDEPVVVDKRENIVNWLDKLET